MVQEREVRLGTSWPGEGGVNVDHLQTHNKRNVWEEVSNLKKEEDSLEKVHEVEEWNPLLEDILAWKLVRSCRKTRYILAYLARKW